MSAQSFSTVDYVVFFALLLASGVIGVSLAWRSRKNATNADYLLANRSITWLPMSISMVATLFSAVGVMGIPAQIYMNGMTFALTFISSIPAILLSTTVLVPMFRKLKLTSVNEYLELRYSAGVRSMGCILFNINALLYMSVVLYAPALALYAVAGVPLTVSILSTGFVCTFYTVLGGMRAVIWTDVFQSCIMLIGLLSVLVVGAQQSGGLRRTIQVATKWNRVSLSFDPDPTNSTTFWTIFIGTTFTLAQGWTISQPLVQRVASCKTIRDAKIALWAAYLGTCIIAIILLLATLFVFASYDCDLRLDGKITSYDQILPYFVADKMAHIPGMPGLFTASLFAFSLSTLSSGLNGISALFLEDVVKKIWPNVSVANGLRTSKLSALVGGIFIVGFAFLIPYLGHTVIRIVLSISGSINAPYLTMFLLGIFSRKTNYLGATIGALTGVLFTLWLSVGQMFYPPNSHQYPAPVNNCTTFNTTAHNITNGIYIPPTRTHSDAIAKFYSVSYLWFGLIAIIITAIVGLSVSAVSERWIGVQNVSSDLVYEFKQSSCKKKREECQSKEVELSVSVNPGYDVTD